MTMQTPIIQDTLPGMGVERLGPPQATKRRTTHRWDMTDIFGYCDTYEPVANLGPAPCEDLRGITDAYWVTGGPVGRNTAIRCAVTLSGHAWPVSYGVPLSTGQFTCERPGVPVWKGAVSPYAGAPSPLTQCMRMTVGRLIGWAVAGGWRVYATPEREYVHVDARNPRTGQHTWLMVLREGSVFGGRAGEIRFGGGDWPCVDTSHPWQAASISREAVR